MKRKTVFMLAWMASALMLAGQSISVTSPNGGEHLKRGAKHTIKWTSSGLASGTLKITLWKGSSNVGIIASGVPCSLHTFEWTVGNLEGAPGAAPAPGYTIKVKWQNQSLVDESDAPFTITTGDAQDFNLKWLPGVSIDPGTGTMGEICSFTARFLVEKGTLQLATVHCLIQPEGVNNQLLISSKPFQNIAPGNPVPVTVQWRADRMGEHQVLFRFDADIRPVEPAANRSDNRIGATFRVRGVPGSPVTAPDKSPNLPDFHIYGMTSIADDSLVIKYENFGAMYQGDLELMFKIKGIESKVSRHVVSGHGTRSFFPTGRVLTAADLSENGRSVGVWAHINPDHTAAEKDFTNNELYMTVYPDLGIPDYHPVDMVYEVTKRSNQPRKLPFGHLKVKVKNLGSACNGHVTLNVRYRFINETGFPHALNPDTLLVNMGENEVKWLTVHDFWWPVRDTTTKETITYQFQIMPGTGNPEIILTNNQIEKTWQPDGPF